MGSAGAWLPQAVWRAGGKPWGGGTCRQASRAASKGGCGGADGGAHWPDQLPRPFPPSCLTLLRLLLCRWEGKERVGQEGRRGGTRAVEARRSSTRLHAPPGTPCLPPPTCEQPQPPLCNASAALTHLPCTLNPTAGDPCPPSIPPRVTPAPQPPTPHPGQLHPWRAALLPPPPPPPPRARSPPAPPPLPLQAGRQAARRAACWGSRARLHQGQAGRQAGGRAGRQGGRQGGRRTGRRAGSGAAGLS